MDEGVRAHLWIDGRVQGVGFRIFAAQAARDHGLAGFVRNLPDGRVEAAVEGARRLVEAFVAEVSRGPLAARVRSVDVVWEPARGESAFVILPG